MADQATYGQYKKHPRLYVAADLAPGAAVEPGEAQGHYLKNVMRLKEGDPVRLFNGRDGEYIATVAATGKKGVTLRAREKIRDQARAGPGVTVLVSPLRREAMEWMTEKATELGARAILPVLCDHTAHRRVNADRLRAIATEAAEQCERMDVPDILDPVPLPAALAGWNAAQPLVACVERMEGNKMRDALENIGRPAAAGVLVGPEGGFSPAEIETLAARDFVVCASLGPRVLRAETALCAALAAFMLFIDINT